MRIPALMLFWVPVFVVPTAIAMCVWRPDPDLDRKLVAVLPPRELEARRATSLAALQQILDQARPDDSTK
ncbi:Uncharacterized protein PBTT_00930 [Plasmodiophora brassicae]